MGEFDPSLPQTDEYIEQAQSRSNELYASLSSMVRAKMIERGLNPDDESMRFSSADISFGQRGSLFEASLLGYLDLREVPTSRSAYIYIGDEPGSLSPADMADSFSPETVQLVQDAKATLDEGIVYGLVLRLSL